MQPWNTSTPVAELETRFDGLTVVDGQCEGDDGNLVEQVRINHTTNQILLH